MEFDALYYIFIERFMMVKGHIILVLYFQGTLVFYLKIYYAL